MRRRRKSGGEVGVNTGRTGHRRTPSASGSTQASRYMPNAMDRSYPLRNQKRRRHGGKARRILTRLLGSAATIAFLAPLGAAATGVAAADGMSVHSSSLSAYPIVGLA